MSMTDCAAGDHLGQFLCLSEASAKAFPELPSIIDRAVLLVALALADGDRRIRLAAWAERSGIGTATLERFALAFAKAGYLELGDLPEGYVRLEQRVMTLLQ